MHDLVGQRLGVDGTPFGPSRASSRMPDYPGYSADFFDGTALRRCWARSWATDARLVRRSFRNWFQPHYPYVFAKFRCVEDEPLDPLEARVRLPYP